MRNFLGRSGAAIGVVGLLAAGLVGVAAPAQAENHTRNVYVCNSGGTAGLGSQSITANPGDTIKVWNNCDNTGGTYVVSFSYDVNKTVWWISDPNTISLGGSGSAVVAGLGSSTQAFGQAPTGSASMYLTVNSVSEPVPAPPAFEPHDYLQQVALPASGSCDDIPPESGHWRGTPFGGWSQSWAQWANDGNGGPVCTRMTETTESGALILVG
jgi:hypothetical protein